VSTGDEADAAQGLNEASNPWQERDERGLANALAASVRLLVVAPRRLFRAIGDNVGIWPPLFFAALVAAAAMILNGVLLTVLAAALPEPAFDFVQRTELWNPQVRAEGLTESPLSDFLLAFLGLQAVLIFLPVVLFAAFLVSIVTCGGIHLLMKVTRTPSRHGFRGTWTASCYASGIGIVAPVPVIGDPLAIAWGAVLFALGLRVVQGLSTVRAALFAAILPLLQLLSLLSTLD